MAKVSINTVAQKVTGRGSWGESIKIQADSIVKLIFSHLWVFSSPLKKLNLKITAISGFMRETVWMGPCLKIRLCSCTKLVNKYTPIYVSRNIYSKCQPIYLCTIFMISCFNQFLFRLTDSQCSRLRLELFFCHDSTLCKICMSTEHDQMLTLSKLQQSWARLRREQTCISLIMLIRDTCWFRDTGQNHVRGECAPCSSPSLSPALPLPPLPPLRSPPPLLPPSYSLCSVVSSKISKIREKSFGVEQQYISKFLFQKRYDLWL